MIISRPLNLFEGLADLTRRAVCAGRVLSAENEAKIKAARDELDAVLAKLATEPEAHGFTAFNRSALSPGMVRIAAAKSDPNQAEVFIYGDIGGWYDGVDAEDFAKEIAALDAESITVQLNSPGGIVFDGIAIYNALVRHKAKVTVEISGIAASIASVIAMAGDEIRINEGSHVMIHKPWSFAIGDAEAMRKEAEILDKLESGIVDIYEARTGKDRSQLEKWVAAETWFCGQEAVDAGFADVCNPAKKKEKQAARSTLLNLFRNTPKGLVQEPGSTPAIRDFERILRDGGGLSNAEAKRVSALAAKAFSARRDGETEAPLRDEGQTIAASDLGRITNLLKKLR